MSLMKINKLKKYINPVFVETGSGKGSGIQKALDAGFKRVISIELDPENYKTVKKRFENHPEIEIYLGYSQNLLESIIKNIDTEITFFLDAHANRKDEVYEKQGFFSPILMELEIIKKHPIKTHTLILDDVRLFGTQWEKETSKKNIYAAIKEINKDYKILYEDGDKPGCDLRKDNMIAIAEKCSIIHRLKVFCCGAFRRRIR